MRKRAMELLLLSVHVMAGIVFVGGSAVATSLFPRYVPVITGVPSVVPDAPGVLRLQTARAHEGRSRAVAVALQIYPRQRDALAEPGKSDRLRTLHMLAGLYNLLWTVVVVLMIVRPGSRT
ncbi:hypothetical protein [Nonomuraea guangzhouensis]|uniref:DUF2269 family protein n=1 Tax=Nonomuraea guangzhouensis TaxID=1291555 RepID=A0ABW4GV19_9ACTN|nr:hypothetical protein [Nonomuraea guangzhouensis]